MNVTAPASCFIGFDLHRNVITAYRRQANLSFICTELYLREKTLKTANLCWHLAEESANELQARENFTIAAMIVDRFPVPTGAKWRGGLFTDKNSHEPTGTNSQE